MNSNTDESSDPLVQAGTAGFKSCFARWEWSALAQHLRSLAYWFWGGSILLIAVSVIGGIFNARRDSAQQKARVEDGKPRFALEVLDVDLPFNSSRCVTLSNKFFSAAASISPIVWCVAYICRLAFALKYNAVKQNQHLSRGTGQMKHYGVNCAQIVATA